MRTPRRALLALWAVLLLGAPAGAVPMVAPPSAFDGSETRIDFETLTQDEVIASQFSPVLVTSGLFGDTVNGPSIMGSGVTASNFQASSAPFFDIIDITFLVPMDRFRFDAISNGADDLDVLVTSVGGGTTLLSFNTSLTPLSVAIQDTAGMTAIRLIVTGPSNHALAIDNFDYAIPEPGAALLVGLGLALLGVHRRRR